MNNAYEVVTDLAAGTVAVSGPPGAMAYPADLLEGEVGRLLALPPGQAPAAAGRFFRATGLPVPDADAGFLAAGVAAGIADARREARDGLDAALWAALDATGGPTLSAEDRAALARV